MHLVHVADHVGVAGADRQRLDPDHAHVHLHPLRVDADRGHGAGLARQAAGHVERVGVADGVDGHVHAAALGGLLHARADVVLGQVHRRRRRTTRPSAGAPSTVSMAITRSAPGGAGGLHGAQADRAEAEHRRAWRPARAPAILTACQPVPITSPANSAASLGHPLRHRAAASGWRAARAPARPGRPGASRASCRGRTRAPRRTCGSRRGWQKKHSPQAVQ